MNHRFVTRCIALVTFWTCLPRANADIIVHTDGKLLVGRVAREDQTHLHLAAGTPEGPREIPIPRTKISRLLKDADETRKIDAANDAPTLAQWTAAYYFADLESSATRCLERAAALDPALAAKPMPPPKTAGSPAAKFAGFWNRAVFRRLTATLPKGNAQRLLDTARWARAAGMTDAAAHYLRRAWNAMPANEAIRRLAAEWSVPLESWAQLDLTPALDASLLSVDIVDENVRVIAEPGKLFLTLPIRYDVTTRAGPSTPSISRTSLLGKDARGFYGLRLATSEGGRIRLDGLDQDPIYERLELLPGEANSGLVVLRNKLGPRRIPEEDKQKAGKPRQAKLRDEPRTIRSTGVGALVLEVPDSLRDLTFNWADGGEESVDLAFLRAVREISLDQIRPRPTAADDSPRWSSTAAVARSLAHINASPVMAALAIERLSRIRQHLVASLAKNDLDEDAFTAWIAEVDSAVISAGARDNERVRLAAWRYFCTHPADQEPTPLPGETLDLFADEEPAVRSHWIAIVAKGLHVEEGGAWWRQTGGADPRPPDPAAPASNPATICRANAIAILGALLRSDDRPKVDDAIDVLTRLKPPVSDWSFLEDASITAQRAALSRIKDLADRTAAVQLVQALILSAKPETASDIAEAARALGSTSDDPNDLLLAQWWSLHPPSRKPAFLAALAGINLGESVYSSRFAEVIKDATAKEGPAQDAAWRLFSAQLRLRHENIEAGNRRPVAGPFPLIIARSANDPLTRGAAAAIREAAPAVRIDALKALVESGYAEQAAVGLMETCSTPSDWDTAVSELTPLIDAGHRDAILAMLGNLLNKKCAAAAPRALLQLSQIYAATARADQWRVLAAIKAGVHLGDLDELGLEAGNTPSAGVLRWLHALGHMLTQDRQRLAAANDPAERAQRLQQINFRRGQLVDGHYGVLAIFSTTRRLDAAPNASPSSPPRWSPPRQITLPLDPLLLETRADQDAFNIRWGDRNLGEGLVLQQPQPIRGPAAYFPAVETIGPWGPAATPPDPQKDSADSVRPAGPLCLPHRAQLQRPAPGTMTLDLTAYLTAALKSQNVFSKEELAALIPDGYKITLRYGAFGSFYGCGPRRLPWQSDPLQPGPTPPPRPPGPLFLINVMLVAERID